MADEIFENPRLAAIYDPFDPDRSDLDAYELMVNEFGAHSVLDIGCGTGTFACRLAARDIEIIELEPAQASLKMAQTKPWSDLVTWIHGTALDLPPLRVDLATMTANISQVFLSMRIGKRHCSPFGMYWVQADDWYLKHENPSHRRG